MAILDKLIEKKDLMAYTIFREKSLRKQFNNINNIEPEKRRQIAKEKLIARIDELQKLRNSVNSLKEKSKKYARS